MASDYINTPTQLGAFVDKIAGSEWLAVDTEFMRERTYYAELCLVQIATLEDAACIDVQAITDLDPLLGVLNDRGCLKVLHAARQDLEILLERCGQVPAPVFDTQVAASVLGHGDQISYAALVRELTGQEIDKSEARTDWKRRPLSPAQIRYALDDVRHLARIYPLLRDRLECAGRLPWLDEDHATLTDRHTYEVRAELAWQRIKGAGRLGQPRQLQVLRALAAWRENRARDVNRPRRWVLADDVVLELARRAPQSIQQLQSVRGIEAGVAQKIGPTLLDVITAALEEPREQWPEPSVTRRLEASEEVMVETSMSILRLLGARQGVSAPALATRSDIERVVRGEDAALLHGWRRAVAGSEILAWIKGERVLRFDAQHGLVLEAFEPDGN